MSRGIDYSKWDKIEDDDDLLSSASSVNEDEKCMDAAQEQDHDGAPVTATVNNRSVNGRAEVTTFREPTSVTIGPGGHIQLSIPPSSKRATASPFGTNPCASPPPAVTSSSAARLDETPPPQRTAATHVPTEAEKQREQEEEDDLYWTALTRNGYEEAGSHLFSQDRETVTVSFFVPYETKSKDVTLFEVSELSQETPCGEIHETDTMRKPSHYIRFTVRTVLPENRRGRYKDEITTLTFQLRHRVQLKEDLLLGCWSLHTFTSRRLRVISATLWKEALVAGGAEAGLFLWWDKCFVSDAMSVDTSCVAGRSDRDGGSHQMARVWEEAHAAFRAKKQRQ